LLHILNHRVGHPGDQIPRHLAAVDVSQVVGDVAGSHALRIQREHRVIEAGQPPRVLGHHRRTKRPSPVPGHADAHLADIRAHRLGTRPIAHIARPGPLAPLVPQMLDQLGVQRRLQHLLGQPGQQPTRPRQLDALTASSRDQLLSHRRQIRRCQPRLVLHISDVRSHA
jgi:hypothetical protein